MTYKSLFSAILLGWGLLLGAQVQKEDLLLLTDRGHYISGELISYRVFYRGPAESKDAVWSSVLYVELIQPNGNSLVQGKVHLDRTGARGTLAIPEGLSSGTYYLKSYTRWMRNCGPEDYLYTSIRIYDPINEQVLPVDTLGWEPGPQEEFLGGSGRHASDALACSLVKEVYGTREEVVAEVLWKFPDEPASLTMSVTKTGIQGDQEYFRPGCGRDLPKGAVEVLPEIQGLSITGQAINSADGTPAPYATIYISILGDDRDFFCNYSDSGGRFYFSFPDYQGTRDLFVSAYHADIDELELLIDRDFSQDALKLPSKPLILNDTTRDLITEMLVNAQVNQQYYPAVELKPGKAPAEALLFYGRPTSTVNFDDFIRLPTLEEYFAEVVPQVSVRRTGGVRRLVLLGEHPELAIYPPLIMIDGVAIFDLQAVLAVSPRLIERVEIVNAPYIRGNVTFGGIISLISKNNDLGHIDLPSSGLLVNYRMFDLPLADTARDGILDPRMPDVRNTLYWNEALELKPGERQQISFRTADLKGSYEILIRGTDATGKYLEHRVPFMVE